MNRFEKRYRENVAAEVTRRRLSNGQQCSPPHVGGYVSPVIRNRGATFWRTAVLTGVLAVVVGTVRLHAADAALFDDRLLPRFRIELSPEAMTSLRRDPRAYVGATVREGTNVMLEVAVRLKGRKGSFRKLDDKPALTLDLDRLKPGQGYRGLTRLHLNNSVEDPSFLHELIGAELFLAAGVPAPRVGHALVELNGKFLGLYVLKEGFAPEFLARNFARSDGEVFEPEPGAGADVNGPMRGASPDGGEGQRALRRLAEVVAQAEPERRWQQLTNALDVDRFVTFLAMEILIGHRDGYALARNNYRIYRDPAADRLVFLPAGMDQLFGRTKTTLWPRPSGLVASVVVESSAGRQSLHQRMQALLATTLVEARLTNRVRNVAARLVPQLGRAEGRALLREADDLCERILTRLKTIEEELPKPVPGPLEFQEGVAVLRYWRATGVPEKGRMDRETFEGRPSLHVLAVPRTSAAWRTKVWLLPGRYRFEALMRLKGLQALAGVRNAGACLSAPGRDAGERSGLAGDMDWSLVMIEFEVKSEDREVELLCQIRASAGEAWFDESSLRLIRLQ